MTELERYENCRKERELITDFLSFVLRKHSCYLGNGSGNLNITAALDEYFGIDSLKLEAERRHGHTTNS